MRLLQAAGTAFAVAAIGLACVALMPLASRSAGFGPPDSTLKVGEQSQRGGTGTFCWFEQRRFWFDGGRCVDMVGIPVPADALTVPSGASMTFRFGGDTAPSEMRVEIISARIDPERVGETQLLERNPVETRELPFTLRGTRADILADLPRGEYAISISVRVPTGKFVAPSGTRLQSSNDAIYGFHIVVK